MDCPTHGNNCTTIHVHEAVYLPTKQDMQERNTDVLERIAIALEKMIKENI